MSARRGVPVLFLAAALCSSSVVAARAAELREVMERARHLATASPTAAESLLRAELPGRTSRETAQLRIELGDLAMRASRTEEAAKNYRESAQLDPTLETPVRRLIDLGLRGLPDSFRPLFSDLASAGGQHPSVVLRGYRDLIRALAALRAKAPSPEDSARAATRANLALVKIVDLLACSTGRLDIDAIGVDSAAVPEPYAELRDALATTASVPPGGFWMSSTVNRNVLARTKLAQGRRAVAMGRPDLANSYFEAGLRVAPSYHSYGPGAQLDSRMVRLDLCTGLIGLLANRPESGPGSPRFEGLINEIFETKGMAYEANDYEAIQKHHEVLGFVYAAREVWTSTAYARNAIFQLQHALTAAQKRRTEVGYQPLPHVRATLARGLDRDDPTKEGSALHLEAAQAYLDVDQLDTARTELGRSARFFKATRSRPPGAWHSLLRVLGDREAVDRLSQPGVPIDSSYDAIAMRWFDPKDVALPKDFVERQRFKILSDLAALEVPSYRRQVVTLGMAKQFEDSPTHTLVGVADLLRLERLQSQALAAVDAPAAPPQLQLSPGSARKAVLLTSTAGRTGIRVVPSQDLGVALWLVALQDSDSTLRRSGSRVVLRRDSIVIETKGANDAERQKIRREVKKFSPRELKVVPR